MPRTQLTAAHERPYTLRVRVEAPDFPRLNKTAVKQFDQPAEMDLYCAARVRETDILNLG